MINAFLKIRFLIYALFGFLPDSRKIEKKEKQIEDEFNALLDFQNSDELSRYEQLKDYLHSDEFKRKKNAINALKYKGSEPYNLEKKYKRIRQSEPVKSYLKVEGSKDLSHYMEMKDSEELNRYYELNDFFDSEQFDTFKKELKEKRKAKKKAYKDTLKQYKKLQRKYQWFFRFRDSKAYADYLALKESDKIHHFEMLKEEISKTDFKALKKQYAGERKNRLKELKQQKKRHKNLKKQYGWFVKLKASGKHQELGKIQESSLVNEYMGLNDYIDSVDFRNLRKSLKYEIKQIRKDKKDQERRYKQLHKQYKSNQLSEESQEYNEMIELGEMLQSGEHKNKMKALNLKNTEEYQHYLRLKELEKSREVKTYVKYKKSGKLDKIEAIQQSDEYKAFEEIHQYLKSAAYQSALKEASAIHYKNSLEYQKWLEYKKLKKDPEVRKYRKIHYAKKLKQFEALKDSREIQEFLELQEKVNSEEFRRIPDEIEQLTFKHTNEYQMFKTYQKLKKDRNIRKALRFSNSKKYSMYKKALESDELQEYQELKNQLQDETFIEQKKYLKKRNKFKHSKDYQYVKDFRTLKNSKHIRWYFKNIHTKKFDFQRNWKRTFWDDFQNGELDRNKWLTSYYWGKALLNDSYVQSTDAHFFTAGSNLKIDNSLLSIITREEEVEGKAWHPKFGFYPRQFSYTSGIINTGQSFRQNYGLFRAKVKLSRAHHLRHCFWLVPDRIYPEIDVFHFDGKKPKSLKVGIYTGDPRAAENLKVKQTRIKGINLTKRFHIISLDWKPGKLIWKINNMTVKQIKSSDIPDEPMYMILNSGLDDKVNHNKLPKEMQIDWVEAYKENQ